MSSDARALSFRQLRVSDVPLLYAWLSRPHVAEWFGGAPASLAAVAAHHGTAPGGTSARWCYLALVGDEPVGFL
jgi:hypothetical protein